MTSLNGHATVEWLAVNIYGARRRSLIHIVSGSPDLTRCGLYVPAFARMADVYSNDLLCKMCQRSRRNG